jgi:hypothetical protein
MFGFIISIDQQPDVAVYNSLMDGYLPCWPDGGSTQST